MDRYPGEYLESARDVFLEHGHVENRAHPRPCSRAGVAHRVLTRKDGAVGVPEETAEKPYIVAPRPRQAGEAATLGLLLRLDHVATTAAALVAHVPSANHLPNRLEGTRREAGFLCL